MQNSNAPPPLHWLNWPAPDSIKACYTLRGPGDSCAPYAAFNLAEHVGDDPGAVQANRYRLQQYLGLPSIHWLNQVHGTGVIQWPQANTQTQLPQADACSTLHQDTACAVLTADCLPIFLCDGLGHWVALIHAGWRGLAAGIIERTLQHCRSAYPPTQSQSILAYLGPAIGPAAFTVGEDVRQQFIARSPAAQQAFTPATEQGYWQADLHALARQDLQAQGITEIYGQICCTAEQPELFYSYRRDGTTGRMASLIWQGGTTADCPTTGCG